MEDKKFIDIARKTKEIEKYCNINLDAVLNKLTQELGEFNDAVQKLRGIYSKSYGNLDEVKEEAGDLIFNFISILQELGINPDDLSLYAENTLKKFEERKNLYAKRMKITICGSMTFYEEMLKLKAELEKGSHEVKIPIYKIQDERGKLMSVEDYNNLRKNNIITSEEYGTKKKGAILEHFNKIEWCDSILIINHDKNGVRNYIGANTLMEMGLAMHLGKKIFLLNEIPEVSYKEEILGASPVILNGDLSLIK